MKRIDTATKAVDLFGAGKHGFKDGNLGLGVLPTDFDASICNNLQEEPANLVELAGIALDGNVRTQVTQAIKRLAGANVTTVTFAMSPFTLTADHAGLVLVDCTGGNVILNLPAATVVAALPIEYVAVKTDASVNTGTFNRAGANTIDGATSFALATQYQSRTIRSNAVDAWASIVATNIAKQIQPITAAVAGSALTVTLNPTQLDFRATPVTSGTINSRTLAAAASLVIPSGATLGSVNAVPCRLVVLALDNAGAIELAAVNLVGGSNLDETSLISTTAITAAANAANVIYSNTARANLPFRVVGFVDSTQAVAGTYATPPVKVQGAGGQAISTLTNDSRAFANVTGSRVSGATYTNGSRTRDVGIVTNDGVLNNSIEVSIEGLMVVRCTNNDTASGSQEGIFFTVLPFQRYSAIVSPGILSWVER